MQTDKTERILVTGGMGFIGSAVVPRLAEFAAVTVADRGDFGTSPWIADLVTQRVVESVRVDLSGTSDIHARLGRSEFSCVIHMASLHFIPACERNPSDAYRDNVMTTLRLLKAAAPGTRFVQFSTAAVYGPEDTPHSETRSAIGPLDVYGWTKKHAEDLVGYYARAGGLSSVNVRLFNAVGRGETNPHVLPEILEQLRAHPADGPVTLRLGNTHTRRDLIHIDDIARVMVALVRAWPAATGEAMPLNVGTGETASVAELIDEISRCLKRPVRVEQTPGRARAIDRPFLCADVSRLRTLYPGFAPRPVSAWLPELLDAAALRTGALGAAL